MEYTIETSAEALEATSALFMTCGAGGVEVVDPEVLERDGIGPYGEIYDLSPADYPRAGIWIKGYFPVTDEDSKVEEQLRAGMKRIGASGLDVGTARLVVARVSEDEWADAWKKYYRTFQVSDRITVRPLWEEYQPVSADEIIISLDPGMSFGTGSHPTTAMCLRLLEKYLQSDENVIDVGCGSGILSIAAAKLGATHVLALDLDDVAVHHTKNNVIENDVDAQVEVRQGDLLTGVSEQAHLVISNILAEVIVYLAPDIPEALLPGGTWIASGIIADKETIVVTAMKGAGLTVLETIRQGDWVAIAAKKMIRYEE
ncbi:50S ribosomal protein L11 methyltransferase [Mechercharimyces sp. CAU 1602]|uniref:50S ribosomal protein L11 methyltransferase n=1 Tax=Mechercharimyces sp. CAU 1602 TaxID=2973933 RepID=UPI002163D55E|nr:50S ribosomal protein L11 methyltransferase [Mechercharimyces sp. CAU 1602]MCS1350450.1 50S ribosomal protein L11 methyltransferase [Mechercharimyces sp. CAU 1602]